ncbi:solute carrier family 25 member [Acrasis kona]|uniref:Solute carrier family 25 member n=1 Tax=Acrasis kona TaxID=1008807 RepID=A0AAW2ZEV5_9EUKA
MKKQDAETRNGALHFFAGGFSGCAGATVTQPLDVLKTRLQSSLKQEQHKVAFGTRTIHGLSTTFRKEGVPGLFRGLIPNLMGVVPSRAIYFYSYETTKDLLLTKYNVRSDSALVPTLAAASAGIIVPAVMNPLFLVKTRVQIDSAGSKNVNGYGHCIREIYKNEGVVGFYKGLSASMLGIFETAIYFVKKIAEEERARKLNISLEQLRERGASYSPLSFLLMSGTCKAIASMVTYPHEVARTRMRERIDGKCRYPNLTGTFKTVFKEEGIRGLYSGMGAHLIRVVPNTAIMFCCYEAAMHYGSALLNKKPSLASTIPEQEKRELLVEESGTEH